jgi:hypothetical protein
MFIIAAPSPLRAQIDFDPDAIFQAPAGTVSDAPTLPPSAADPFTPPPVGSIPLGSAASPLTSPAAPATEFPDDPFGTPAPENRQVRQVGVTLDQAASETVAPATADPADPAGPAPTSAYVAPEAQQTLDEAQRARLRALFPDMLPPEDQTISALTPSEAPAGPEQPEEDGAAIGRAGALLTQEYYGQAKILPPLELSPIQEAAKASAPATEAKTEEDAAPVKAQSEAKLQPAAEPKTAPSKTAKAQDSQARMPDPALPRGSLALVNETGDPQVGAVYQSALSRLGYTVLAAPAGGFSGGPAGQTVIYFRPGAQPRALAVSRDLPGRKALAEAPAGAASDIVVVLR